MKDYSNDVVFSVLDSHFWDPMFKLQSESVFRSAFNPSEFNYVNAIKFWDLMIKTNCLFVVAVQP